MDSNFQDEERRPRTVIRARAAAGKQTTEEDCTGLIEAVTAALDPFPEARMAVVAALKATESRSERPE